MTIARLILREIVYRKLNFGLAVVSVVIAVACLVAVVTALRMHDWHTEDIVAARAAETKESMRQLEDDYRKITLNLGFNLLILPKDLNLADWFADDFASKFMPEEYALRLARSGVATINHVLPSLLERVTWEEKGRTILIAGSRGELPIANRSAKKPLVDAVPPGTMAVGHELHRSLGLAKGDKVKLTLSHRVKKDGTYAAEKLAPIELTVHRLLPPRGTRDDITIRINLAEAQDLLHRTGQINSILALECNCAADRLDSIRSEVGGILPDTQVIELASQALTRAEARNRAAKTARAAVQRVKDDRAHDKQRQEEFAALVVPLVLLASIVGLGILGFNNARARTDEIGILRALGIGRMQVLALFLVKAALVGLLGALLGFATGLLAGAYFGEASARASLTGLLDGQLLLLVVLAAPAVCLLATALPALQAVHADPADVLQQG